MKSHLQGVFSDIEHFDALRVVVNYDVCCDICFGFVPIIFTKHMQNILLYLTCSSLISTVMMMNNTINKSF